MEKFSDFYKTPIFDGTKISINEVLDKPIQVLGYRKAKSKKKENTDYATIQIVLGGEHHVIFTGSDVLMRELEASKGHIPFETAIKKIGNSFSFT